MIKIIMNGYNGKMGKTVCSLIDAERNCEVVAGVDVTTSNATFPTFLNINDCDMPADVIIDFSTAMAVPEIVNYAVEKQIPLVICTTGLSEDTLLLIEEASKKVAIFKSANMSLGINLIVSLIQKAIGVLDEANFDVEIVERHHNQKIDAPSGTALLLADSLNEAMQGKFEYVYDRSQTREKRDKKELGISAVRGGTIVGDHSVIFAGKDEVIEINHSAYSKEVFAVGAVNAAKFLAGKKPDLYNMQDLMNEQTL